MNALLILGAGGHGRVVADAALAMGKWSGIAFADDADIGPEVMGLPVVGRSVDLGRLRDRYPEAMVAIGDNRVRVDRARELAALGYQPAAVVHPRAAVAPGVVISPGTVVMAGAVVNCGARLGANSIVNTGATVDHDCVIGEGVHISPGAHIAGDARIGPLTWVGMGACVINGIRICGGCVIGAGAVVIGDINEAGTYAGIPARKLIK